MGGRKKTSTRDVTIKIPRSLCLKYKMETASVPSPTLSGHVLVSISMILTRCYSIFQRKKSTQTKIQARKYGVAPAMALALLEAISANCVLMSSHSMVNQSAIHGEKSLVMIFQLMMLALMSSLIDLMGTSQ